MKKGMIAWHIEVPVYENRILIVPVLPLTGREEKPDPEILRAFKGTSIQVNPTVIWDIKKKEPWTWLIFSGTVFHSFMDGIFYDPDSPEYKSGKEPVRDIKKESLLSLVKSRMFDKDEIKKCRFYRVAGLNGMIEVVCNQSCEQIQVKPNKLPDKKSLEEIYLQGFKPFSIKNIFPIE